MDLLIRENGEGGDVVRKAKDLTVVGSFENMPYLAMFGGNLKESTPLRRIASQQGHDYWANSLLFPNAPELQFNSETERALNTISLTSNGRVLIEQAVKKDLAFMRPFAKVEVEVSIITHEVIQIFIKIKQPDNLQEKEYLYIWDGTLQSLRSQDEEDVFVPVIPSDTGFDYFLDFDIE